MKQADHDLHVLYLNDKSILIMKLNNWTDWKSEVHIVLIKFSSYETQCVSIGTCVLISLTMV